MEILLTTGRSSIASSTPTVSEASGPTHKLVSCRKTFRSSRSLTGIIRHRERALPLEEILRNGVRDKPEVSALASLDQRKLSLLVWHYHDDDVSGPDAEVELAVNGVPLKSDEASLRHFRIDEEHSNAFSAWKRMGSPQSPTPEQYKLLEKAGQLAALVAPEKVHVENGKVTLKVHLPRQAVSLLELVW